MSPHGLQFEHSNDLGVTFGAATTSNGDRAHVAINTTNGEPFSATPVQPGIAELPSTKFTVPFKLPEALLGDVYG